MSKEVWAGTIAGIALAIGIVVYFNYQNRAPAPQPEAEPAGAVESAEPEAAAPEVQYPVPAAEAPGEAEALPRLDDSDEAVRAQLAELVGTQPLESFLIPKNLVRNLVITLNSLTAEPVPMRVRAAQAVEGRFAVRKSDDVITLGADNARRYRGRIEVIEKVDAQALAEWYFHYYALFQEAYEELGFPGRHFNDRVVAVIDHLLATPEVADPIVLVRPKVLYEFADPELEERSSGQKALIRMGAQNAAVVKAKLRTLREAIVAASDKTEDARP